MSFFKKTNGIEYIICGLGNPGAQYTHTRHNAGFIFLDYVMGKLNIKINKLKHYSLCEKVLFNNNSVLFMKPQTYMNESGRAVKDASFFYKVSTENIIIVCDDINLPIGSIRIRKNGSAGGQKGLKSIIEELQTDNFIRVRIGVGSPTNINIDIADYVLGKFSDIDMKNLNEILDNVFDSISLICDGNIEKAMNKYNKRGIGSSK